MVRNRQTDFLYLQCNTEKSALNPQKNNRQENREKFRKTRINSTVLRCFPPRIERSPNRQSIRDKQGLIQTFKFLLNQTQLEVRDATKRHQQDRREQHCNRKAHQLTSNRMKLGNQGSALANPISFYSHLTVARECRSGIRYAR